MTPKQARFVDEYLRDLNATQAAIRAGYSERYANDQAAQLLKNPTVAAAINEEKQGRSTRTKIDADRVLQEIASMAFFDPADLMREIGESEEFNPCYDEDGKIYGLRGPGDIRKLPEDIRRAIVGWGYDRNQNFTVKLADKSKALDQLGRHLSLFNDTLKVGSLDGLGEHLARLTRADDRERAEAEAERAAKFAANVVPNERKQQPERTTQPAQKREPVHQKPALAADASTDWRAPSKTAPRLQGAPAHAPPSPYKPVLPWPSDPIEADYDPFKR